jgi:hypothetical protein
MSDTSNAADDFNHPSQAEGEDPDASGEVEVLPEIGKPSQAEGGDPDTDDQEVEVLPEEPAGGAV